MFRIRRLQESNGHYSPGARRPPADVQSRPGTGTSARVVAQVRRRDVGRQFAPMSDSDVVARLEQLAEAGLFCDVFSALTEIAAESTTI